PPERESSNEIDKNIEFSSSNDSKGSSSSIDPSKRVHTGINGFDELIEGGFEKNSIVLVVGSAGTGKTLLGMQFLYEGATKYNEPGIFISFEESRESLYRHALQFGWDFEKLEREEKFKLLFFKPHQVTKILEEGGGQIRDSLSEINATRVVVDSITAYGLLFKDEYKRREKVLEFFNLLGKWNITSIVIAEDSPLTVESKAGSIAFISDAVISMYYHHDEEKGIRIHSIEILKMRGTKHTNKLCAINFENDGITVYPDVEVF
ncbi:MAG: ATPase domain-containing protein, partial [Candidatus ainarchaeum sp.]|nr:ATPase domain-containing protein [Candidatus ainarchaeum sp.]